MVVRTINDPSGLSAELVERLVGLTAYDVVKLVAAYLPEIRVLAENGDGLAALVAAQEQLLLLVPEIPGLQIIAENVEELINGTKPASLVTYEGQTLDQILGTLLYQQIVITSFAAAPSISEVGTTLSQVQLTWALSRSGTLQKINDFTLAANARAYTSTLPIGTDTSYVLRVEDGARPAVEATAVVRFRRKRYWGVSENTSLTDEQILGLGGSEFAENRLKTIVFNATGGRYPYYAYPASFGLPTVKVQGNAFSDFSVTTRSFTNAAGSAASYNIIRFNGIQTGAAIEVNFA